MLHKYFNAVHDFANIRTTTYSGAAPINFITPLDVPHYSISQRSGDGPRNPLFSQLPDVTSNCSSTIIPAEVDKPSSHAGRMCVVVLAPAEEEGPNAVLLGFRAFRRPDAEAGAWEVTAKAEDYAMSSMDR